MFKVPFLILFAIILININPSQAQYTIKGKVTDTNAKVLDLVLVTLLLPKDSSVLKAEYTDPNGTFELSEVSEGKYILKMVMIGFEPVLNNIDVTGSNLTIEWQTMTMVSASTLLDAVTISAKVPYVERKIDRTVVNVDALIANAGSTALEALERAPGVSVDQDGSIRLKGRSGVIVYIDDKPTYLSGVELENYLKSLPAGTIKQIEIMTNPPAKYEAAGNSGVINIITKKNKLSGFYGNSIFSLQRGQYTRSNNSMNLNFNKNKISLYANINGGFRESFQDLNINRYYKRADNVLESAFAQNSFIVKNGQSLNIKTGLDYYLSDKSAFGFSVKGIYSPNGNNTDNKAVLTDGKKMVMSTVNADNRSDNKFSNGTYNVYWRLQLDTMGSLITIDGDYVRYGTNSTQIFKNTIYNIENVLSYQDRINGSNPSSIRIYAAKADYSKPIDNSSKLEAGIKSAFTKTDNEAIYFNTLNGLTSPDYNLSNRFLYDEWIQAAYLNYTKKIGKFDIQFGLRGESTVLKGNQLGNPEKKDSSFTRTYNNLFPTVFVSWQADSSGHHIWNFSYGRRIDRPYFQDLNPFISPLDKFTFYGGNPDLLPTFSHNFSFSHSFRSIINTSLNFSKTNDGINETLEIRNGIYYSRPGNIATSNTYSISVDAAIEISPRYSINAYSELGYLEYKSKLYTQTLNSGGRYYMLSATNSFTLGKGWNADVRGDYQSDIIVAQLLIKSFGTLNFAFQKKILKDAGSLKFAFNDVLYTRRADGIINNLRLTDADWNSRLDTRSVTITFSYRFGKSTSDKPKHTGSGSESEQQRVKG